MKIYENCHLIFEGTKLNIKIHYGSFTVCFTLWKTFALCWKQSKYTSVSLVTMPFFICFPLLGDIVLFPHMENFF